MEEYNIEDVKLKYEFMEHFYIADKYTYEAILCECLNKSNKMVDLAGDEFSLVTEQSDKEPDVIAENTNYALDFKMMISGTLKKYQSRTATIIQEIVPGVKSFSKPPSLQEKVSLLWNSCKDMSDERMQELRTRRDMESKAVIHFFDKVINHQKHILLFIPVYFSTVDRTLSSELQYETIFNELSITLKYIYRHRQKQCSGFDTFLLYIVKIPQNGELDFVITKFIDGGLELIDKVPMFSLESVKTITEDNRLF